MNCFHLFLVFVVLVVVKSSSDYNESFVCFDSPANITFNNTGELVPDLWQARIITPSYSSQFAVDYLAYLFMREKLGMDVVFWPYPNDPKWWEEYYQNDTNSTYYNRTYVYPDFYWQFIEEDYIDLSFENWPIQEDDAGASAYYAAGTVERSYTGLFGEVGWYMPKYFVDSYPTAVVVSELASDQTLRDLLIAGSMNGTTLNYYEEYKNISTGGSFDKTDRTDGQGRYYPVIWGSYESYIQSQYSFNLTRNLNTNLSFICVGGEVPLQALVADLYSQKLPFIANIYIPDDNFATLNNTGTGELQRFEKVALPFNSGQSVDADCYQSARCANPLSSIKKLKSPALEDRFPEMSTFFAGLEITADQLALLMSYYTRLSNATIPGNFSSMVEHYKWMNATCEFLKDPDSEVTWNSDGWLIPINRYDCQPGCGVQHTDGTYVGGTCDYLTQRDGGDGTCECDYDELDGDDCEVTCPGTTAYKMNSGSYALEFCSGHGTCSAVNKLCDCDNGWGKNDCGTKFDTYEFDPGLGGFIIAVSSILACGGMFSIFWLRSNAHYKTVKALSVDMTSLFTVGIIFLALSNIPLVTKVTDASCIGWQWLFGIGGIMAIMSPLLKAYRVSRVFHGGKMLRAVKITDKMLMKILIKALLLEFIICISYAVLHQVDGGGGTEIYYNEDELQKEPQCNQSSLTNYVSLGSYAYFFIMLCLLTKYSYGTRRALSVFKESTCAYFSSFLSLFCTLITFAFNAATSDPLFRNTVQAFAVIIVVTEVLIMFYGMRMYTFYTEPENRNVTDGRSISSTTTTSTTGNFSNVASPPPKPGPQNA